MNILSADAIAKINRLLADMPAADAAGVHVILAHAEDQLACAALIHAYLHDQDRADRTPRGILYLFYGLQQAIIANLADALQRRGSGTVH